MQVAHHLITMYHLAVVRGSLIEAEADLKQALKIQERLEPDSIDIANRLRDLADVARAHGDFKNAESYLRQCLKLQEKLAPDSLEIATTLAGFGMLAHVRGYLNEAENFYKKSMKIRERLAPNSMEVAISLRNLGDVAKARADFAKAETYYRRCLDLQQKLSPDSIPVSISLDLLGTLALMRDNLLEAEADLKQSLSIQERLEPGSLDVASSLRNLGDVARARGDLSTAEAYYQQCVDLRQKFAPTAISMAVSLGRLSDVEAQRQELVAAERHAQQAWEIVRSQYDTLEGDAARLTYRQGNQPHVTRLIGCWLALHQTEAAFATLEQGRARVLQQLLMDHHLVLGAEGDPTYLRYRAATRRQGRAVEDLDHARVQCDIARHALDRSTARRDAVEAATLRQALEAAKQRVGMATSAEVRARLEVDDLYCELRRQSGSRPVPPISIEQARASLPTDTLFAAFAVGEQQSYLFLISRDAPIQAFTLNITHKALESEVKALRDRITDAVRYTPEECARAGRQLYGTLFPQEAQVDLHQVKRLIISPEGSLWEAPFAALVTKELKSDPATAQAVKSAPNTQRSTLPALSSTLNTQSPTPNAQRLTPNASPTWLGLQMPITYANSLTLFAYSRSQRPTLAPGQAPTALVVGDCLFARNSSTPRQVVARRDEREGVGGEGPAGERSYLYESGEPPQRLPATGEEARSIAHLYGVAPLLDEQATEAAVRSRLPQADVIHLATHGVLRQEVPLASGVLLTLPKQTRANTPTDDDGDLQTWEIAALKLKAELVVLSACKTGLGAQVTGEGLIGLTRALQIAGCRSVVTSQWSVEDTSTSALMVAFHSGLRQGLTKDVALQQAMRSIAEAKDGRTAHPHYWAAFVLTGDPDNPNLASRP
jgi:CHAT domain-containing protein